MTLKFTAKLFFCSRMIGRSLKSRALVASPVKRLYREIYGDSQVLLRQDGVNFCFRFRPATQWYMHNQRMQYCSNVVNSPHPDLTVPKDPPVVPQFILNTFKNYSKQTALVG